MELPWKLLKPHLNVRPAILGKLIGAHYNTFHDLKLFSEVFRLHREAAYLGGISQDEIYNLNRRDILGTESKKFCILDLETVNGFSLSGLNFRTLLFFFKKTPVLFKVYRAMFNFFDFFKTKYISVHYEVNFII